MVVGIYVNAATARIYNNIIKINRASYGSGIYFHSPGSGSEVINNTITLNRWGGYYGQGSSTYFDGTLSQLVIENNIIAYNPVGGIYCSSVPQWKNNYVYGNTPSDYSGSITNTNDVPVVGAPGFVDAAVGDVRLVSSSPCIDAGDNSVVFWSSDVYGGQRIFAGNSGGTGTATVDVGACEYGVDPTGSILVPVIVRVRATDGSDIDPNHDGSTWAKAKDHSGRNQCRLER